MTLWYLAAYTAYILREVIRGSLRVSRAALTPGRLVSTPAIVEFPLRCRTDLEVVALASSITITPGTIVLGTAAADVDRPPTLFVHDMFSTSREETLAGLRDMEARLLRATRAGRDHAEAAA